MLVSVGRELDVAGLPGPRSDDLRQSAYEALTVAARGYDARRQVPFGAFARHRVRGAVIDGLAEAGGIPRRAYRRMRFDRGASDLLANWPDGPAGEGLATKDVRETLRISYLLATESEPEGERPDEAEISAGRRLMRQRIQTALGTLPDRERDLLEAHYFEGRSLADAGRSIGLSRSWASRIHRIALTRLRKAMGLAAGP